MRSQTRPHYSYTSQREFLLDVIKKTDNERIACVECDENLCVCAYAHVPR